MPLYVSFGVMLMTEAGQAFVTGMAEGKDLVGRRQRPSGQEAKT